MEQLTIKPLQEKDITLMEKWLQKKHVAKWFDDPQDWLDEINKRESEFSFIHHFIVYLANTPIGFCQYYKYQSNLENWSGTIPLCGTFSIDYMIGEEACLKKGYGKKIVALLTKTVFSLAESKRIIVQPEQENLPSCKALLANGFIYDKRNKLYLKEKV